QATAVALQFRFVGERPRFGLDPDLARGVLAFGLPVASANLLSWALLGIDKILLSTLAGAAALGVYYLAFNVANWPMSVLGQIVRSISLPAFARYSRPAGDKALPALWAPVAGASLLCGL